MYACCLLMFCFSNEYQSDFQGYVSWAYNNTEEKRTRSTYLEAVCSYARKTLHCQISRARKLPLFWPEERLLQTVHLNTANPERCFVSNCFQGLPELFHLSETRRKRLGRRFSMAVQIDFSLSVVASRGAGWQARRWAESESHPGSNGPLEDWSSPTRGGSVVLVFLFTAPGLSVWKSTRIHCLWTGVLRSRLRKHCTSNPDLLPCH